MKITLTNQNSASSYQRASIDMLSARCLLDDSMFVSTAELTALGFQHPLLTEEAMAPVAAGTYVYEYDDFAQLLQVPRRVYATLLTSTAPSTCCFEIKPSPRFVKTRADYQIPFALAHNQPAKRHLTIAQLEGIVSYFKNAPFVYQDSMVLAQTIRFADLPSTCQADDLYQADEDVLAFCQRTDCFDDLEIRYINVKMGFGVYARHKLAQDSMLMAYVGEKVPKEGPATVYGFTCGADLLRLDIDAATKGNIARFVNHSEKKHALQDQRWLSSNVTALSYSLFGLEVIIYRANRDIRQGEQLLVYYGANYFKDQQSLVLWHRNGRMLTAQGKKIPLDTFAVRQAFYKVLSSFAIPVVQPWQIAACVGVLGLAAVLLYGLVRASS